MGAAVTPPTHLDLMFDCNDHRNGEFRGVVTSMAVYRDGTHIVTLAGCEKDFRELGAAEPDFPGIKVYGVGRAQVIESRQWVGNWCWNSYRVSFHRAAFLISMLNRGYGWLPEHGAEPVFNLLSDPNNRLSFSADEFAAAMEAK